MVNVVILAANGEFKVGKVGSVPSAAAIAKALRKTKVPDFEGSYTWNETIISIWGWTEGKSGNENNHELPEPHDNVVLFGDVIATIPKGDLTIDQWKAFTNIVVKGIDELVNDDSEEEEEFEVDVEETTEEVEECDAVSEVEEGAEEEGDVNGSATDDEEAEEEEADDECYDSDEGAGGGRRRTQRRRTTSAPEYRRMDMGLRSRIKIPTQIGKRAPRWQTATELEQEEYTI